MKTVNRLFVSAIALSAAILGCGEALAAPGDLYAGGTSDNVVYKFTPAGSRSTFATGLFADSVAFDTQGNLFISDTTNKQILKITPGGTVTVFASGQNGENFVPGGLAFDSAGNLYAASTSNGFIYKYTPAGTRSTFASGINGPFGLAFDGAGNLFVTELNTNSILKFTPSGIGPTTFATGFTVPLGITFDASGALYEADFGTGRVLKVSSTGTKTPFAVSLIQPRQLAFDPNGNLFVVTVGDQEIVKIAPNGTQTVFATSVKAGGLAFEPALTPPPSPTPTPTPAGHLLNIATRLDVLTNDRVLIGGFIITGNAPKKVLVRAIGPSLSGFGIAGALADPTLELHNPDGSVITNDNWKINDATGQSQEAEVRATTIPPSNDFESAIVATLAPGAYSAIVSGKGGGTGIGLVEAYDLDQTAPSTFANIATRGFVDTGDNVMIGGFIIGPNSSANAKIVIRAIGPSLTSAGVPGALQDPTLELRDANGTKRDVNDNWQDDADAAEIRAVNLDPKDARESALLRVLPPGGYTAIVSGSGNTTGVGLVEVYDLQ